MSRTQSKPEPKKGQNPAGPLTKKKGRKNPPGVSDDTRVVYSDESNPDD